MSPPKPKGIPDTAFWRGGINGGNWFVIESTNNKSKTAAIKIYDDRIGAIVADKAFQFDCNSVILWDKLEEQIQMFDGEKILLRILPEEIGKHCYLK